ncbi:MAG: hypothetical protein MI892_22235 [Desulfobacterales bacterium]|nr:hypothetical protein [Desulfobacterales bacterium]
MINLYPVLKQMKKEKRIPRITAYNRIDGPGSSLDLREFQQCLWTIKNMPPPNEDITRSWSKYSPRTVGISINLGCIVEAQPLEGGNIGIISREYGTEVIEKPGEIPYKPQFWLLKALELFNLKGVQFELHNRVAGIQSSGLGGSATATTAVCLLANKLAGEPFSSEQIVTMAATIEQDMGISITGTQEQSCVVYGGVTDYIWFPWGIPGKHGGYGSSIRDTIVSETDYDKIESRFGLYHTGVPRASTDVNKIWRQKLRTKSGLKLHKTKLSLAYDYKEGLREQDWLKIKSSISEYRKVRTELCKEYMCKPCWEIQGQCERFGAESFPLGAGGGGAVMVFCPDPDVFHRVQETLSQAYRKIDYRVKPMGHEFKNLPLEIE